MAIISKKKKNELLSLSNNPEIQLLEENKKSYKIMIIGEKDKMGKNNFEQLVVEFIQEQREFNKKVDQRLEIIENRIDVLESLPTIRGQFKKEIKEIKK